MKRPLLAFALASTTLVGLLLAAAPADVAAPTGAEPAPAAAYAPLELIIRHGSSSGRSTMTATKWTEGFNCSQAARVTLYRGETTWTKVGWPRADCFSLYDGYDAMIVDSRYPSTWTWLYASGLRRLANCVCTKTVFLVAEGGSAAAREEFARKTVAAEKAREAATR